MKIDGRTKLLGILGHGIGHSLSPGIHNHALLRLGVNAAYLPFDVPAEEVGELIRWFPRIGGFGLNVTTPHKAASARMTRPGDQEVTLTGVANTIVYRDGTATAHATDGRGFGAWITARHLEPSGGGVILLGFGATARSIAYQLGQHHPLTIVSRTPRDVDLVLQDWYAKGWPGLPVRAISWQDPTPPQSLLVVGGLPVEFARSTDVAAWLAGLDPAGVVVDLNYGAGRTPLRDQARDRGLASHDGLGLLVHQAALSLSLWLSRDVPASLLQEGLNRVIT